MDAFRRSLTWVCLLLGLTTGVGELVAPGFRPLPAGHYRLEKARLVIKPGTTIPSGTVVLRDGLIIAAGEAVDPSPGATVIDLGGHTVYAGFIDPYLMLNRTNPPVANRRVVPIDDQPAAGSRSGRIRFLGDPTGNADPGRPGPGTELNRLHPDQRVADSFAPDKKVFKALRELGFTSANVVPANGVLRGTSAFVALTEGNPNDTILRADVAHIAAFREMRWRERNYPTALMGVIASLRQSFYNADHYARDHAHYAEHPVGRKRPEFNPAWGSLHKALERKLPVIMETGSALMVDQAARIAAEFNLNLQLVASGHEWRRPDIAKASGAPFIVPLNFPELPDFPDAADWDQVSLDQLRTWDWAPGNAALLRRQGLDVAVTTYGLAELKSFRKNLKLSVQRGLAEADATAALTTVPARLCGMDRVLGTIEPGKIANLTVVKGDSYFEPDNNVESVWIDGRRYPVLPDEPKKKKDDQEKGKGELRTKRTARPPLEGRGALRTPRAVLVRNATIWTCGPEGRLEKAELLAADGTIKAVGRGLDIPGSLKAGLHTIDAEGGHVTPGLVDAHSHSMILGGVNEGTLPSTAMVRIGDVINSETANIYRQLGGGLTTANLLHGSANPIGGQNAIIKLRDGQTPSGLRMKGAPEGIKFALGENVKQSNWGDDFDKRFPQTRMGVPTFMANRFTAARQYLDTPRGRGDPPVRRDLELDAIGEIIRGERWIHCHSYRQDEILALLRLMEGFQVRIGTLQHVLEGYKVADEIAEHGAGASCFSDWWAYKFEVYDAIPHAGSLMRDRGVLVSFNSDSSDLARRLNLEAAKAVKYGGTPEVEALHFVTINPARQMMIDKRVGSLEPGKDADFVLWSRSPLDTTAVCLETWIDGRQYFDRSRDRERTAALNTERSALLEKARALKKGSEKNGDSETPAQQRFFERCLEHEFDHVDRHCMDHE